MPGRRRFFRLLAEAPPVPGDTPAGALAQAHLWLRAASTAANEDLTDLFQTRWRLPPLTTASQPPTRPSAPCQ